MIKTVINLKMSYVARRRESRLFGIKYQCDKL